MVDPSSSSHHGQPSSSSHEQQPLPPSSSSPGAPPPKVEDFADEQHVAHAQRMTSPTSSPPSSSRRPQLSPHQQHHPHHRQQRSPMSSTSQQQQQQQQPQPSSSSGSGSGSGSGGAPPSRHSSGSSSSLTARRAEMAGRPHSPSIIPGFQNAKLDVPSSSSTSAGGGGGFSGHGGGTNGLAASPMPQTPSPSTAAASTTGFGGGPFGFGAVGPKSPGGASSAGSTASFVFPVRSVFNQPQRPAQDGQASSSGGARSASNVASSSTGAAPVGGLHRVVSNTSTASSSHTTSRHGHGHGHAGGGAAAGPSSPRRPNHQHAAETNRQQQQQQQAGHGPLAQGSAEQSSGNNATQQKQDPSPSSSSSSPLPPVDRVAAQGESISQMLDQAAHPEHHGASSSSHQQEAEANGEDPFGTSSTSHALGQGEFPELEDIGPAGTSPKGRAAVLQYRREHGMDPHPERIDDLAYQKERASQNAAAEMASYERGASGDPGSPTEVQRNPGLAGEMTAQMFNMQVQDDGTTQIDPEHKHKGDLAPIEPAIAPLQQPRPRIAHDSDQMESIVHSEDKRRTAGGDEGSGGETIDEDARAPSDVTGIVHLGSTTLERDFATSKPSVARSRENRSASANEARGQGGDDAGDGSYHHHHQQRSEGGCALGNNNDLNSGGSHTRSAGLGSGGGGGGSSSKRHNKGADRDRTVQNFVANQAETTNMADPNAPTPRSRSGLGSGSNDDVGRSPLPSPADEDLDLTPESALDEQGGVAGELDADERENVDMDAGGGELVRTSGSGATGEEESVLSTDKSIDEPVMTVRFEHKTDEDGHHVVIGREGKLERCEDEPITMPGAVQGFGVLMVLEEEDDTGNLAVRQVSENSTELLGLSPRYLFRLQCFTHILPKSQDDNLRDNIDYLVDPDRGSSDLEDEGPQVFLLSGYGEPGSDDSDAIPTSKTINRRREWTCWVAAHRPSQRHWKKVDERGRPIAPPSLVVLEFELERDIYNPLHPPLPTEYASTSGPESPGSGSGSTLSTTIGSALDEASGGSTSTGSTTTASATASGTASGSQQTATSAFRSSTTASDSTMSGLHSSEQRTSETAMSSQQPPEKHEGVQGLEGEDFSYDPADILESTTSYAKPVRALERMRRMTRTAIGTGSGSFSGGSRAGSGDGGGQSRSSRRGRPGAAGVGTMDVFAVLAQINDQLGAAPDLESFLKVVVGVIKDLTQFHRCLVYSFDSMWNGQVVAELVDWSKTHDLYKGLMFPMTDIPAQARELYRINKVRLLYDREQTTARMVLRTRDDLEYPVDMTHSYLRAMSPIHLVYLKNMGVRSSMSISIMAFGSLWGLIALHGYGNAGLRVSFPVRQMLRLLSDSISRNIERLSYAARLHTRKLISTIPTDAHPTGYIVSNADDLIQLFDADSGVLVIGDGAKILGPSTQYGQEVLLIAEFLRLKRYEQMQISNNITEDFPELGARKNTLDTISGLLYVPLSAKGNDFIAFLRKGQLREIHWAGRPYKEGTEAKATLEPRQSFKAWSETIRGRSRNWTDEQLETAGVLALVYGKFIEVWRQKESAMRTNQMTSILLTNASHEVRTPLNHIINYLELALDGQLDSETRENLSRSHVASKSLLFTINDLLDLTRIESGNETAFNDPFDMRQCIGEATSIYSAEAARRGLDFVVDDSQAPDGLVLGDLKKVRTIVANLVANAVKYTTEGKVQVTCRTRDDDESGRGTADAGTVDVEIIVSDTGRGISAEKLEAMFVTFEQADSAPQATGLGLGLAVVARIVEQLGGQLRAESEVGVGTRFFFTLLMARYDPNATNSTASSSRRIRTDSRASSYSSGSQRSLVSSHPSGGAVSDPRSAGGSEIDTFVEAFSSSHMAKTGQHRDERVVAAEQRMNQPGTFPVTDSSFPVKPTKIDPQPAKKVSMGSPSPTNGSQPHRSSSGDAGPSNSHRIRHHHKDRGAATGTDNHAKKSSSSSGNSGPKMRILVVEDDDVNRRILERRLRMDGHSVWSDINGQEALDRVRRDRSSIDAVLMDVQMPVMDGKQSAAAIRVFEKTCTSLPGHEVNGRLPIIAVSATLLESEQAELAKHFDGWILKPVDFRRMQKVLRGITDEKSRKEDAYRKGKVWEQGGFFLSE